MNTTLDKNAIADALAQGQEPATLIPYTLAALADMMGPELGPGSDRNEERNEYPMPAHKYLWITALLRDQQIPARLEPHGPVWDGFWYFNLLIGEDMKLNARHADALAELELWIREEPEARTHWIAEFAWYCSSYALVELHEATVEYVAEIGSDGHPVDPDIDASYDHAVFSTHVEHADYMAVESTLPKSYASALELIPEQFRALIERQHRTACYAC